MKFLTFGNYLAQGTQNYYFCSIVHGQSKQVDGLSTRYSGFNSVLPESTSQLVTSAGQL